MNYIDVFLQIKLVLFVSMFCYVVCDGFKDCTSPTTCRVKALNMKLYYIYFLPLSFLDSLPIMVIHIRQLIKVTVWFCPTNTVKFPASQAE
jgi:hypothetical protein